MSDEHSKAWTKWSMFIRKHAMIVFIVFIKISLTFVCKGPIGNKPVPTQIYDALWCHKARMSQHDLIID